LENQQVLWSAPKGNALALRRFDFDPLLAFHSIHTPRRGWQQFQAIVVCSQTFTKTPDKMTIWSEVSAGEHCFQFTNDMIKLFDKPINLFRIHLTPTLPITISSNNTAA
jgi:hypothetical protein